VKWFLWHGNVFRAGQTVDDLTADVADADASVESGELANAVREFGGYLAANACAIPNYGERRLAGEIISTSFVESAVNQVISKRMVRSSRCAGVPAARTCYCRSAPAFSTTPSPTTTDAGTPASPTPTGRTRPHILPRFVPLSRDTPRGCRPGHGPRGGSQRPRAVRVFLGRSRVLRQAVLSSAGGM
jgi:hypothetical protein